MKVIIAGSRSITNPIDVETAIRTSGIAEDITEVVSGTAPGVDRLGEDWAKANNITIVRFPAQWNINGYKDPLAGFKRNFKMAQYADALIAVYDGVSNGTANMIRTMQDMKKPVYFYIPPKDKQPVRINTKDTTNEN